MSAQSLDQIPAGGSSDQIIGIMSAQSLDQIPAGGSSDENNNLNSAKTPRNKYVIACALLASMSSILLGYDVGVMSGAKLFIRKDLHMGDVEEEMLIGSLNIISLVGAAVAGRTSDAVGRRWTMALAGLIFLLGALLMSLAPSFGVLMAGRLLTGIGVGFALLIAPVYTTELSPASSRGALTSLPEIFINVGILLGYISNFGLSGLPKHLNWRLMLGLGVVPAVFLGLGVLFMPESPRWLVMRNRIDQAKLILVRTSDSEEEAEARLSEIIEGIQAHQKAQKPSDPQDGRSESSTGIITHGEGAWSELFRPSPAVRRMLMIALGVQFFQEATGTDATVYYSTDIFKKAGIRSERGLLGATIAVGAAKAGFVLVATFWLDKVGRRPLLLTSSLGMTASLLTLALGLFLVAHTTGHVHDWSAYVAILATCVNVAFFSVGWGPVCWVVSSEVFPMRLRAKAASLGVMVNRFVSGVVALTFLSVSKGLTVPGTFFLFAGISALASIFVYTCVPETKGKTLEAIVSSFHAEAQKKTAGAELELGDRQSTSPAITSPVNMSSRESRPQGA